MKQVHSGVSQEGFIKPLLTIVLLAASVYAMIQFGIPYYRYSAFKTNVRDIARLELGDPVRTRRQIFEAAEELKLPLEEGDIVVVKHAKSVRVKASWEATVDLMGLYQKTFHFEVDVEE
jgi:hypothetical protein